MQKKIIEVTLDTSTVFDKQIIIHCGLDIPFRTEEQKMLFNKQLTELISTATQTIKDFINSADECNCESCKIRRELHKGGACNNETKSRYRTY